MSNLINKNQRSTAQEPEPTQQPPLPKPPRRLQEFNLQPTFEQGLDPNNRLAGLEIATEKQMQTDAPEPETLAPGESIEFTAPGVVGGESEVGLTRYLGGQLGESLPVQLPNVPAASTPPMTSLWKDATVDLGVPNLADSRLVTTAFPTAYADPLTVGFDPGLNQTFGAGVQANAAADAQANAQRTAAIAKAAQDFQNTRGSLPNTPDASKPWHEQLWGWAGDLLQGTEQERAEEERTGKGTFGAYGSGLGGFFKSVFGVPIAAGTAAYLETWGREEYNAQRRLLNAGNPTVRTERVTNDGKRISIEVPFNSLSAEEKHKYLTEVVSNRLPLGTGALVRTNVDFRRAFGSYIYDALAGNVDDSINNANPKLPPVVDRRTGKLAVPKPARGLLQSANLRPGQEWYEDSGGTFLEIATQLFSPGNKVDAAGELVGLGFKTLARTNTARGLGRAVVNRIPTPIKKGASAVANAGKRTAQAIQQGTFGFRPVAPISQPSVVVGLPQNRGASFESFLRNNGVQQTKPPVVPNVPAFNPKQTPYAPKTDPEGLAAVVGIGQKGQPLSFEPTVNLRSHQQLVEQYLRNNPEKFGSYKGTTWAEWEQWKKANLSEEDYRQLEAVAGEPMPPRMNAKRESSLGTPTTNELNPPRVQQEARLQGGELEVRANDSSDLMPPRVRMSATLDDLQEQNRRLVEQKLSLEAPLKQLEETFDEVVDVGRREIDELPLRPLTEADLQKAMDYGAGVRLSRQLPPSVVQAAAKGNWQSVVSQAQAVGGLQELIRAHNARLQDLSPKLLKPATDRLATDVPAKVYHGTSLENWSPDYSYSEFGSRGELGAGLYTTSSLEEAEYYARATVSNSRSVEVAYDPLAPQVVELDTSKLQATLDARASLEPTDTLAQAIVDYLPASVRQQMEELSSSVSFSELVQKTEVAAAKAGGSEELLRQVSDSTADALRELGYDSVYDSKSGWLSVVDNGKLQQTKAIPLPEPTTTEAVVARYNADSVAAGHYPTNVTSDANLRDSTFQLLDTARNQLDDRLEEVQQQLAEATYKEEPLSLAAVAKSQSFDELRARAKEPPSLERYVRDIQEFGQPLHPVLLKEKGFNPRTLELEYEVVGNVEAYEAAIKSFDSRNYPKVGAMVENATKGFSNYQLVDIQAIRGRNVSPKAVASTKEQVLKEFNRSNPGYTSAPVVLEQTSFDTYRVLDRGYTANAYAALYREGKRNASVVPSMVVGRDGKVDFKLVDLSAIEKKAKALEPDVPKLETKPLEPERALANYNMKELRELGNSLGVKGNSKQKLIERIQEAQAKASAPSVVKSFVVEPPKPPTSSLNLSDSVAVAKRAEGLEYDKAYDGANPHANLLEALDSTLDDSPNICKF